jgi:MFS family permease
MARSICDTISPDARDCRIGVNTARILTLNTLFPGLRPLRHRSFALYFAGLSVSQVGDWMETTTTAWLLYQITGDPVLLGLSGGIRATSIILFGLVGGAIADRTDRRRMLFLTQSGFALASLALGILVVGGHIQPWHIYVFSAVNGALGSFDAPARRALFPGLVPRAEMQSAVVLNAAVFRLGRLVGPAVAGVVIAAYGPAVSYFVNVLSYAAILAALAFMDIPRFVARATAPLMRDVLDGLRYTLRRPLLRSVLILESTHSLFGVNTALVTVLATDVFRAGPEGLGLLLSAQAFGALVGTTGLVMSGDIEHKGRAMIISGGAYCIALALLALPAPFEVGALLLVAAAICDAYWTAMRNTMFQLQTDERYRGRSLSTVLLAGRGFVQAAQLESGIAISVGGPGFAVVSGAAVIALVLGVVNLRSAEVRSFRGLPDAVAAAAATPDPPA